MKPDRDQLVADLRDLIIHGVLVPGPWYSNEALLELLSRHRGRKSVSGTALTQALAVVRSDGLVDMKKKKGVVVRAFDPADALRLLELRAAVEVTIVHRAAETRGSAALRSLESTVVRMEKLVSELTSAVLDHPQDARTDQNARQERLISILAQQVTRLEESRSAFLQCGRLFHASLAAAAGYQSATDLVESLWARSTTAYARSVRHTPNSEMARSANDMYAIAHEHRAIFTCIDEGDAMRAEAEMKTHLLERQRSRTEVR